MNLLRVGKQKVSAGKRWFLAASLLKKLVVIGIVAFFIWFTGTRILGTSQKTPVFQTAQVTKGSIISTLSESGNVNGSQTTVSSPANGVIEEVYVKNGDQVTAGDNLFKVHATATPAEQASAYASYQSAVSSLTTAKDSQLSTDSTMWTAQKAYLDAQNTQNYKNNNTTNPSTKQAYTDLEKQSIDSTVTQTQKDFFAAQQKYKDTGVSVSASQAQVNAAWLSYQATQDVIVTAPIAGTIANFSGAVGSTVGNSGNTASSTNTNATTSSSSSSTTSGTAVLIIGDFSNLQIKVQASEVDVPKIHAGQKATITFDAFPDKTFVGSVSSVDTIGTNSSGVVTYSVTISLAYAPLGVQPGMTASVIIQIDRKDTVLTVPTSAVQTVSGQATVRVMKNGVVTQVPVETGIASDSDTEITSGLSEGDTIVTSVATQTSAAGAQGASPFSGLGGRGGFGGGLGGGGGRGGNAGR